ncbi:hypothetical protein [Heyndrickxia oleronia]|uniref:hypothetical protein n=1 Tax=Heyndrickxia oleronia TaxID=38875 RepID=UPI003F51B72F
MTVKDYKNYHQVNVKDKMMRDGLTLLKNSLDGFEGYDVVLNDSKDTKVVFYDKYDGRSDVKKIIGYVEDIELGNLFKINDENWLVITYPEDNRVYHKAEIQLCNSTFPIESDKTEVLIGYDDYGRPEYDYQILTKDEPCIVETKYYFNNRNEQITLPEDRVMISMKYQKATNIATNKEFDLYESRFRITFIDYSQVINGKGIMTITGERVMNK